MAKQKISPCLCGYDDVWAGDDGYWTVECGDCGLVGEAGENRAEAICLWNRMIKEIEDEVAKEPVHECDCGAGKPAIWFDGFWFIQCEKFHKGMMGKISKLDLIKRWNNLLELAH